MWEMTVQSLMASLSSVVSAQGVVWRVPHVSIVVNVMSQLIGQEDFIMPKRARLVGSATLMVRLHCISSAMSC